MHTLKQTENELFLKELEQLDESIITVDGRAYKPSQCYHIGMDPVHVLFNENCPESLKIAINDLLRKYHYL